MHQHALRVVAIAMLVSCAPPLPPAYVPTESERFWSLLALERWTKDEAAPGSASRLWKSYAMSALVSWRVGKDAPLPHMWRVDSCVVTEGTWVDTDFSQPSHGTVTLTGATGKPAIFTPSRDAFGYPDLVGDAAWPEGAVLTVDATGDSLPGFSVSSTVKPAPQLLTFDLAAAKPEEIHISRTQPLDVTWTPQDDEVLYLFVQIDARLRGGSHPFFHTIWCRFPGRAGAGTIPAEALGTLVDKPQTVLTNMYFGTIAGQSVTTGQDELELYQWNGRALRIVPD